MLSHQAPTVSSHTSAKSLPGRKVARRTDVYLLSHALKVHELDLCVWIRVVYAKPTLEPASRHILNVAWRTESMDWPGWKITQLWGQVSFVLQLSTQLHEQVVPAQQRGQQQAVRAHHLSTSRAATEWSAWARLQQEHQEGMRLWPSYATHRHPSRKTQALMGLQSPSMGCGVRP